MACAAVSERHELDLVFIGAVIVQLMRPIGFVSKVCLTGKDCSRVGAANVLVTSGRLAVFFGLLVRVVRGRVDHQRLCESIGQWGRLFSFSVPPGREPRRCL